MAASRPLIEGKDFSVCFRVGPDPSVAVLSFHSGAGEHGAQEIADALAQELGCSLYIFENTMGVYADAHTTSNNFDDPRAAAAKRWADGKFKPIEKDMAAVKSEAVNNHGPEGKNINLRDQIDTIQTEMRAGFRRMDHQFGEAHDREIQTTHRIENLEKRAEADHKQLRVEIARKRDK